MHDRPSGFRQLLGYRVEEWKEGYARLALTIGPRHLSRNGRVHGGVITTLVDAAGGYSGSYCPVAGHVRRTLTVSLSTQFIAPVKTGTLIATGQVRGGGKQLFFATVEIRDGEGNLVAVGEASYRYRKGSEDSSGVPMETGGEIRDTDLG